MSTNLAFPLISRVMFTKKLFFKKCNFYYCAILVILVPDVANLLILSDANNNYV